MVAQPVQLVAPVAAPTVSPTARGQTVVETSEPAPRDRTMRRREPRAIDLGENPNYLDIPAFLRRQAD
jgi:hypothetical protein